MQTVEAKIINALTGQPVRASISITDQSGQYAQRQNGHVITRRAAGDGSFILPIAVADRAFVHIEAEGFQPLTLPADSAAQKTEFKLYPADAGNVLDEIPVISTAVNRIFPQSAADPGRRRMLTAGLILAALVAGGLLIYFIAKKSKS